MSILTVNSLADNVSGTTSTLDLREAVLLVDTGGRAADTSGNSLAAAKASQISGPFGSNDTIQFDPSLFGATQQTITLGGSELLLSQSVTIAGPGSGSLAISGNGQSRVFEIVANTSVNLSDVTITGGYASYYGGGMYNAGTLNLSGVTITGGYSSYYGGGIANDGTLNMSGVTITGGSAVFGGGGVYNAGTLNMSGVTITGGFTGYDGGGIANAGTLTVNSSYVCGNSAGYPGSRSGNGGGINNWGTLTATNTTISDNSANQTGGVYSFGTMTVTASTISGNSHGGITSGGGTMTVSGSTISGNSDGGIGNGGTMTVTSSTISGNSGPAINNGYGTITLNGDTISGNDNSSSGGLGAAISSAGTMTVINTTVSGNLAHGIGGFSGTTTVTNTTISGNLGIGIIAGGTWTLTNTTIIGNSGGGGDSGRGILFLFGTMTLTSSIVSDVYGTVTSDSANNLIEDGNGLAGISNGVNNNQIGTTPNFIDPLLAPLGWYGGPTQTMALLPGSPAIDAGNSSTAPPTDQRGVARVGAPDIGAFESRGFTIAVAGGDGQSALINAAFAQPLAVTVFSAYGEPVAGGQVTFVAPASGASAVLAGNPATIGPDGLANARATANGIGGSYTVNASGSGVSGMAVFHLRNDYHFSGFLPPLAANLTLGLNRTVPIKFRLTDANGNAVTGLDAVSSLQVLDSHGIDVLTGTGKKVLGVSGQQFSYYWQTKGLAEGSYTITLALADGNTYTLPVKLSASITSAGLMTDTAGSTGTSGLAGQLLAGDILLYVENSAGLLTSDELARIGDAVAGENAVVAPYGVTMSETTDPAAANVIVDMGTTSTLGGMADGVLGCTAHGSEVTIIQGWNWYAGADAGQIGAAQYDFQTVVTHELGHALGVGHSTDAGSVMYAALDTGAVRRTMTVADLNLRDSDGCRADALHAVPIAAYAAMMPAPSGLGTEAKDSLSALPAFAPDAFGPTSETSGLPGSSCGSFDSQAARVRDQFFQSLATEKDQAVALDGWLGSVRVGKGEAETGGSLSRLSRNTLAHRELADEAEAGFLDAELLEMLALTS